MPIVISSFPKSVLCSFGSCLPQCTRRASGAPSTTCTLAPTARCLFGGRAGGCIPVAIFCTIHRVYFLLVQPPGLPPYHASLFALSFLYQLVKWICCHNHFLGAHPCDLWLCLYPGLKSRVFIQTFLVTKNFLHG